VFVADAGPAVPLLLGRVIVVVEPFVQEQLHAGQASPAGHSGQLQVQVPPPPLPVPVEPPPPLPVPHPPPAPPVPPPPVPHWQSQGGHASPGPQAGQPQVQVPPPFEPLPASAGGGGGQSHWTGGQAPSFGQASGCTQRQPGPEDDPRSKQKPPPAQSTPTGQSAGAFVVARTSDQAQLGLAWHAAAVVRLAQELVVTQTPLGQEAPVGQASTGIQVQRGVPTGRLWMPLFGLPWHASAVV
jgi:hypothetical protein